MRKLLAVAGCVALLIAPRLLGREVDPRLSRAARHASQNGWIFVHLEGPPAMLGLQHGYLLAPEIRDAKRVVAATLARDTGRDWKFFRDAAKNVLWPRIPDEYRQELQGIAEGVSLHGIAFDIWDITVLNAWLELDPYYYRWWQQQNKSVKPVAEVAERCSAFVATGSWTRDGKPVMGQNAWSGYAEGARWNIIFDIVPQRGQHILMDGYPGLIHSGDDFGVHGAGVMITETTISQFHGFDPSGVPEFVRARKAMQYANSIDDFARIMKEGNNGGYANTWLVADRKTGEIASLELGLKNVTLLRSHDGYFAGANYPVNQKLIEEETTFNPSDLSASANARRVRWEQLMEENKGKIDVEAAKRFLADHYDTYDRKTEPSERTLCGHIDLSPRGNPSWQPAFGPAGVVQAKAIDAEMADAMSFLAAMGHPCGTGFRAQPHLRAHPAFESQRPYLRDIISRPWTEFRALP